MHAAMNGKKSTVELLLQLGADIESKDKVFIYCILYNVYTRLLTRFFDRMDELL